MGHDMGAFAYLVHLERLNKVVTSSSVTFDDIPAEMPFLTGRPDHWTSPAPGVDDAAHEEQGRIEEVGPNDIGDIGPSSLMAGTSPEDPRLKAIVARQSKEQNCSFAQLDSPEKEEYNTALSKWVDARAIFVADFNRPRRWLHPAMHQE